MNRSGKRDPNWKPHPGLEWIKNNGASLRRLYNNQWVAADETGLIAHDLTSDGLHQKLRDRKIEPSSVAQAFITTDALG